MTDAKNVQANVSLGSEMPCLMTMAEIVEHERARLLREIAKEANEREFARLNRNIWCVAAGLSICVIMGLAMLDMIMFEQDSIVWMMIEAATRPYWAEIRWWRVMLTSIPT